MIFAITSAQRTVGLLKHWIVDGVGQWPHSISIADWSTCCSYLTDTAEKMGISLGHSQFCMSPVNFKVNGVLRFV